jgi:hypothetical protein
LSTLKEEQIKKLAAELAAAEAKKELEENRVKDNLVKRKELQEEPKKIESVKKERNITENNQRKLLNIGGKNNSFRNMFDSKPERKVFKQVLREK